MERAPGGWVVGGGEGGLFPGGRRLGYRERARRVEEEGEEEGAQGGGGDAERRRHGEPTPHQNPKLRPQV